MSATSYAKPADSTESALSSQGDALSTADSQFLAALGRQVRELREQRGLTRKLLARQARVSERYLGQLESGDGNVSVILLRRIASALDVILPELLLPTSQRAAEEQLIRRFLRRLPAHRLEDVLFRLVREFNHGGAARHQRVALIGLRGAGKTTLGRTAANEFHTLFIELDREIEQETGLPLSEIFTLYGQAGYRRIERRALEQVLAAHERAVIAVGGGVVSDEDTFALLLTHCHTVWLKAQPEEHMARVAAQGDVRPMAGNAAAMDDLKRILAAREPLYRKADAVIDTSGQTPEESFRALRHVITRWLTQKEEGHGTRR
jgi:XRE family transcriptional regulator, aerobic/anaerobic benzoate catabolism transcriptional regulator